MFEYTAPNPYPEEKAVSISSASSLGEYIGQSILPAQNFPAVEIEDEMLFNLQSKYSVNIERGTVHTYDEAILDTIQYTPRSWVNIPQDKKHFIIKFNRNGSQFEKLMDDHANDANSMNVTVVAFNYRNVSHSEKAPTLFQELVTDGIAEVQRVLSSEGAKPEQITLDGQSLGAVVATMVAEYFHDRDMPVYLMNDRSMSTLANATAGLVAYDVPGIREAVQFFLRCFMEPVGWEANAAEAYKKIPAKYKGYMFVSKKSDGDGLIAHGASLHRAIKQHEKNNGTVTGRKFFSEGPGHNLPRRWLINASNLEETAQDVFEGFVRRNRNG